MACTDRDTVLVTYRFGAGFEIRDGTSGPQPVSLKELVALVHRMEEAAITAEESGEVRCAERHRALAARLRRDAHWQCAIARQFEVNRSRRARAETGTKP